MTYFSQKFEKATIKHTPKTVYLPQDDPGAFELLVYWLYRGKLPETSVCPSSAALQAWVSAHVELFGVAMKLSITSLATAVERAVDEEVLFNHECRKDAFSPKILARLFEVTSGNSRFRIFALNSVWYEIVENPSVDAKWIAELIKGSPSIAASLLQSFKTSLQKADSSDTSTYATHRSTFSIQYPKYVAAQSSSTTTDPVGANKIQNKRNVSAGPGKPPNRTTDPPSTDASRTKSNLFGGSGKPFTKTTGPVSPSASQSRSSLLGSPQNPISVDGTIEQSVTSSKPVQANTSTQSYYSTSSSCGNPVVTSGVKPLPTANSVTSSASLLRFGSNPSSTKPYTSDFFGGGPYTSGLFSQNPYTSRLFGEPPTLFPSLTQSSQAAMPPSKPDSSCPASAKASGSRIYPPPVVRLPPAQAYPNLSTNSATDKSSTSSNYAAPSVEDVSEASTHPTKAPEESQP
jgi:hypothetical protein